MKVNTESRKQTTLLLFIIAQLSELLLHFTELFELCHARVNCLCGKMCQGSLIKKQTFEQLIGTEGFPIISNKKIRKPIYMTTCPKYWLLPLNLMAVGQTSRLDRVLLRNP